jgi:hypothetical protein
MIAEAPPNSGPPESSVRREEDFLFHLYRGSELLDDHRLHEAESELEYALTLEPTDARTQGLLAVVYFRRGLHVRAMTTYERLLDAHPGDPTLRMNLALCYLKTGQSEDARAMLEGLVAEDVTDTRAWGYLALALARLGYLEQAREAFERAGQPDMAWRMVERGASRPRVSPASGIPAQAPEERGSGRPSVDAIDGGELRLDLVRGGHHAVARFAAVPEGVAAPPPRLDTLAWGTRRTEIAASSPDVSRLGRAWTSPATLANFIEDARLERLGDERGITLNGTHLARVELDAELSPQGFAFRLDALRSFHGALESEVLPRQTRAQAQPTPDPAGETFGGIGTPFASMRPPGQLLIGPRAGQRVHAFMLEDEVVFFKESALLGFDLSLAYENGRIGLGGGGEPVPIVQFRGKGTLLIEIPAELLSLDVKAGGLTVRKEGVVGWVGRLLPRQLSVGEAPGGQRGLLGFSGEGTLLVSTK